MDIRHLLHFITLAEEESFVAAAERLGISQSGLTQSIGRLEAELGVKLFNRGRLGAHCTDAGELMLPRARLICAEAKLVRQDMAQAGQRAVEHCSLAVSPSVRPDLVAGAMTALYDRLPDCAVTLTEGWTIDLVAKLRAGEVDIVLSSPSPHLEQDTDFAIEPLYTQVEAVVIGKAHPLSGNAKIGLAELQDQRWLVPTEGQGRIKFLRQVFAEHDLTPPANIIRSNTNLTGVALLDAGLVVAHGILDILYGSLARDRFEVLDIPALRLERTVSLITRRRTRQSRAVKLVCEALRAAGDKIV